MTSWIIAALCAGFLKGLCGVGDIPIFSSILAFQHNNIDISPVSLLISMPTNIYMVWKNRNSLKRNIWLPLSLLIICGVVPGTILLKNTDTRVLKAVFGVFIIFVGILMLVNELSPKKRRLSRLLLIIIGIISGITSGLFGIAILLAVYISQTTDNMKEFKANICTVFAAADLARVTLYSILGIFKPEHLKRSAMIFPLILLGLFFGTKAAEHLDERKAKLVITVTLIISGAAIAAANLR